MKKIIIISISLVILLGGLLMFLMIFNTSEAYRCWKIKLPGIQIDTVLFSNGFQEGDEISKYTYHSKRKMKKMIEINNFELISSKNIQDIQNNVLDFYNRLGTDINGIDGKKVYDEKIDVEQLLKLNNYYLIKNEKKSYIILILDIENKTLYTFTSVR